MSLLLPMTARSVAVTTAIAILFQLFTLSTDAGAAPPVGEGPIKGVQGLWVWRSSSIDTDAAQDRLIAFCRDHGYNRLLIQVHQKKGAARSAPPQLAYPDPLRRLLREAARAGIAVEALDGAKDMARTANQPRALAVLEMVLAFNRAQPEGERFAGMHYDIEPYILPEWKSDERPAIMREYLEFLRQARTRVDAEPDRMLLSADIPMWYDHKTEPGDSCVLEFDGQTKNLHEHVQDLTDYVGIMSYRRRAVGPNSVVAHVEGELAYAERIGKTICAALETIELKTDSQISFFGRDPKEFLETKRQVESELANRNGFGGMLIHHYDGVRALLDEGTE